MLILYSIPVDIVEIIVVSSKDYKLFETLKKVLYKLEDPLRVSRINDKLTITKYKYVNKDFVDSDCENDCYCDESECESEYRCKNICKNNCGSDYLGRDYTSYHNMLNYCHHREYNKPAIVYNDGDLIYSVHHRIHRGNDCPAMCSINYRDWYIYDDEHRENDLPIVIKNTGTQIWIIDYEDRDIIRENNQPDLISCRGIRYYGKKCTCIFDYLDK